MGILYRRGGNTERKAQSNATPAPIQCPKEARTIAASMNPPDWVMVIFSRLTRGKSA